jgi:hypothetical protein
MTETKEKQRGSVWTALWRVVSCASESGQKQWKSLIVSAGAVPASYSFSVIAHPDVAPFDRRIYSGIFTRRCIMKTSTKNWKGEARGAGLFQKALRKALDTYETRCADKIHKPWYLVTLNNFQQFTVERLNATKTLISLFSTHGINKHVMFNEESSAGLTVGKTTCRWCWLTFKLTAP